MEKLAQFFKLKENNTTFKTEIMAGITTFMASAFTILAIPGMISNAGGGDGDPRIANAVFIAACLSSAFGTLLKAFYAKLPFVQAPGMGLGAYFSGTVMGGMAMLVGAEYLPHVQQYQMALALVFIAGVIFTISTLFGIRDAIIEGIPKNIKLAMGAGIGLFITLLGLRFSGIVVGSSSTFVTLVNFRNVSLIGDVDPEMVRLGTGALGAIVSLIGLLLITILSIKKVKGAILISIIVTTILTYITGVTSLPENFSFNLASRFADFFELSFLQMDFSFLGSGTAWGAVLAFTLAFVFVNMLDALGTIYGISVANGMVDEHGEVPGLEKGLTADAIGTAVSGLFGSSTTTTVVSSASGISEGGRTGLTSLTTGILFLLALFFAPFVVLIPNVAVAPALIYVGFLMVSHVREVDFKDPTEAFPAFLTVVMMPLSFSIANGIAFGLISYIVIKLFTGRIKEVKWIAVIITFLFILQYIL
jgi:AGZA family xanthine/uracil permease-like MFS transporter